MRRFAVVNVLACIPGDHSLSGKHVVQLLMSYTVRGVLLGWHGRCLIKGTGLFKGCNCLLSYHLVGSFAVIILLQEGDMVLNRFLTLSCMWGPLCPDKFVVALRPSLPHDIGFHVCMYVCLPAMAWRARKLDMKCRNTHLP